MIMDNHQLKTQVEVEKQLLACIFADDDSTLGVMAECLGMGITEEMFTGVNKSIYNACKDLFKEEELIDAITVALRCKLDFVECTDITKLRDIATSWKFFADELMRHDLLNRLNRTAMYITDSQGEDPEETLAKASRMLEERPLADEGKGSSKEIANGFLDRVREQEREGVSIITGITPVDRLLRIRNGQLITIAARPSVGKSALAGQIAFKNAVSYGKKVAFFSLEMSEDELMMRGLSLMSGVGAQRILDGMMTEEQKGRVDAALERIAEADLYIIDEPVQTADFIYSRARQIQQQHGLDLVVIDYAQLVKPSDPKASREQQVGQISRDNKAMARRLEIPVIQLAQVNRDVTKTSRRPRCHDLRESGSLEQDTDSAIFIHPKDAEDQSDVIDVEIIIDKQRNGPKGIVDLQFIKPRSYFKENKQNEGLL